MRSAVLLRSVATFFAFSPAFAFGSVDASCARVVADVLRPLGDQLGSVASRLDEARAFWAEVEGVRKWSQWAEQPSEFLRFVRLRDYEANRSPLLHGVELYGLENYRAWKRADRLLSNIPRGEFKPTLQLVKDVHRTALGGLEPALGRMNTLVPEGLTAAAGGRVKRFPAVSREHVWRPLDEEAYGALVSNPWLGKSGDRHGFVELPVGSGVGERRGWIVYAAPQETEKKLQDLIAWYEAHKVDPDPIQVAAEFHRAFLAIRPFDEGNGRVARLFVDRILSEAGLPPPILEDGSEALTLTTDEWALRLREGIERFMQYAREEKPAAIPDTIETRVSLARRPNARRVVAQSLEDFRGKEIRLGGRDFLLLEDGFLYGPDAVPYVLRDGQLYPISDRAYFLYEHAGTELKIHPRRKGKPTRRSSFLAARREVYRSHFQMLRDLESGALKGADVRIADYATIKAANEAGELFLYPWQRELFEQAIDIPTDDPVRVLIRSLRDQTPFEEKSLTNSPKKIYRNPGHVLSQYEKMDLIFREYERAAGKQFPDLVAKVRESRRKLHAAARTLLADYEKNLAALKPEVRALFESTAMSRAMRAHLERSKVGVASFDEGVKRFPDDKVVLFRTNAGAARHIGFLPESQVRKILNSIPGADGIRDRLGKLLGDMQDPEFKAKTLAGIAGFREKHPKLAKLVGKLLPSFIKRHADQPDVGFDAVAKLLKDGVGRVYGSEFASRGVSENLDRMTIEYFLHQDNFVGKDNISFTTSAIHLVRPGFEFFPYTDPGFGGRAWYVELDAANVGWNHVATRGNQYEVLQRGPAAPWRIVHSITEADLAPVQVETPELLAQVEAALANPDSTIGQIFARKDFQLKGESAVDAATQAAPPPPTDAAPKPDAPSP